MKRTICWKLSWTTNRRIELQKSQQLKVWRISLSITWVTEHGGSMTSKTTNSAPSDRLDHLSYGMDRGNLENPGKEESVHIGVSANQGGQQPQRRKVHPWHQSPQVRQIQIDWITCHTNREKKNSWTIQERSGFIGVWVGKGGSASFFPYIQLPVCIGRWFGFLTCNYNAPVCK